MIEVNSLPPTGRYFGVEKVKVAHHLCMDIKVKVAHHLCMDIKVKVAHHLCMDIKVKVAHYLLYGYNMMKLWETRGNSSSFAGAELYIFFGGLGRGA